MSPLPRGVSHSDFLGLRIIKARVPHLLLIQASVFILLACILQMKIPLVRATIICI